MRLNLNHSQNHTMKIFKPLFTLIIISGLLLISTSCLIIHKTEPGRHKGWNKNSNNPHHPNTTNPGHTGNPGKSKGKGKK